MDGIFTRMRSRSISSVTNANGVLRRAPTIPTRGPWQAHVGRPCTQFVGSAAIERIPAIDGAVTLDPATGQYCVLLLNRDLAQKSILRPERHPNALGFHRRAVGCGLRMGTRAARVCGTRLETPVTHLRHLC